MLLLDCTNIVSLTKNDNNVNNNHKTNNASDSDTGRSVLDTEDQKLVDMLRNDTLDVLEGNDFYKVVADCAEDCINLIADYLESSFRVMPTPSLIPKNSDNNDRYNNSVEEGLTQKLLVKENKGVDAILNHTTFEDTGMY